MDGEMSESDPEESYAAIRSVVTVPTAAAQGARKNRRVDELRERLVRDYPRLFSGVANKIHRIEVGLARRGLN